MITKIFKAGNSLAVHLPNKIAFDTLRKEVDIQRQGNVITITLVENKTLAGMGDLFKMFSLGFMAKGRGFHGQHDRDWVEP